MSRSVRKISTIEAAERRAARRPRRIARRTGTRQAIVRLALREVI